MQIDRLGKVSDNIILLIHEILILEIEYFEV
jgi:hypothetical protein